MSAKPIEVLIGGQSYRLSVAPENESALRAAVAAVDAEMSRIRNSTSAKGQERVAVMAAISLASDLLALRADADIEKKQAELSHRLAALSENIAGALHAHGLR